MVLPAYNAGKTLRRTVAEIDRSIADDVVLVDDASRDDTVQVARELGLHLSVHARNRGYGGNQKTCYAEALKRGADIVVMLHPDYQYSPRFAESGRKLPQPASKLSEVNAASAPPAVASVNPSVAARGPRGPSS